jgi:hypothetical protein
VKSYVEEDAAEKQLRQLMERRSSSSGPERHEAALKLSHRKRVERERAQNKEAWGRFYARLGESLAVRAADYHRRARALLEGDDV